MDSYSLNLGGIGAVVVDLMMGVLGVIRPTIWDNHSLDLGGRELVGVKKGYGYTE